ncbi:MAG: YigZ family protein [Bacillota bacterium]
MYSIKEEVTEETIIKHSRFLSFANPVFDKESAEHYLQRIKNAHPDANHHCFAYIIGEDALIQKAEDDGEPSKTAGMPILETLKKNSMTNIIVIVVRYFGGIKLGAGGLIRAYGKATSLALEKAMKTEPKVLVKTHITVPFDLLGTVEHELESLTDTITRSYNAQAHFEVTLEEQTVETLQATLKEKTSDKAQIDIVDSFTKYL